MPVSHIGLTVSHLPSSSSFFLSALQPLGYRYTGQQGHQVGFGIREADFFLCQETPGVKAGAAHIAFTATSRTAVREFYSAALNAGGRPNGSPACRTGDDSHFNAAVLDFDGNSIEVVFSGKPDYRDDGTVISHSRVITWERTVTQSMRNDASVISSRTARSVAKAPTEVPKAPSVISQAPSVARSISEPAAVPQAAPPAASRSGDAATTLVGTLLGAAAGAAVAYAFVRSERDSAKKESDFSAFMEAKNAVRAGVGQLAQAQPPQQGPPPAYEPAPSVARSVASVHRNDDAGSVVSASPSRASQVPSTRSPRQIEAAPASYYAPAPSQVSLSRSQTAEPLQIEYMPARSVAGSDMRSRFSSSRSMTSPEIRTIEAARSIASMSTARPESRPESRAPSRAQSVAHSTAPSSFISSYVPDHVSRKPEGSVYSHHSSRSKTETSYTDASRHNSHSRHTSRRNKEDERSPSPPASEAPSKKPSKAASVISSLFSRNKDKKSSADSDFIDDLEIEELSEDDYETVVPSDSISQVGSSRRSHRRKHRSRTDELKEEAGTSVSKSSHRSHRSHRSHKSRSQYDSDSDSDQSTESRQRHRSSRYTAVSEPSDVSTIKPSKSSSRDKERRKDSVTEGSKYDDLFDQVQYGHGSVPVRGITPSMINASTDNSNRSVLSFAMGKKMKTFEG